MKLLVLGGGGFLGFHMAAEAVRAGYTVTTFNRDGKSELDGVEALAGDRRGDLSALEGRSWDAVIDTFSDPGAVGRSAELLSGSVGAYGFVSGISVYHPDGPDVVREHAPLRREGDPADPDPLQERSLLKLACERVLTERFAGPLLIVRPGIMVGPRDPTDRFTWWPVRLMRALRDGAPVLAPGDPDRPAQFTDARDLAAWAVGALESRAGPLTGTFNAVGPGRQERLRDVLTACLQAAKDVGGASGDPELVWAAEDFLAEQLAGVEEEARPLWFPEPQIPFVAVDSSAALAAGLQFRSSYDTARDTLLWRQEQSENLQAGFSAAQEAGLLAAWRQRA